MSETKDSVHQQISALNESFGQITNQTNISSCANQDADLSEDGINDDCKGNCSCSKAAETAAIDKANEEIAQLNQSFGEITPQTNEHPYADQDANYDEDGIDSDANAVIREEELGEPVSTRESLHNQISALNESFGQITDRTNADSCANQDADLSEDGINDDCKGNCSCSK